MTITKSQDVHFICTYITLRILNYNLINELGILFAIVENKESVQRSKRTKKENPQQTKKIKIMLKSLGDGFNFSNDEDRIISQIQISVERLARQAERGYNDDRIHHEGYTTKLISISRYGT